MTPNVISLNKIIMTTITKKVPIAQVPKAWLEGVDGADKAPVIDITLNIPEPADRSKIKQLLDSIVPSQPKSSDSLQTLRDYREEMSGR